MKHLSLWLACCVCALSVCAQDHLGVFEEGDEVPFAIAAADPVTGEATTPTSMSYSIIFQGDEISGGALTELRQGIALGVYSTTGQQAGPYIVLVSGVIGETTGYTHKNFNLVEKGRGIQSIGAEASGLNGLTPLSEAAYLPYYAYTISNFNGRIESVTAHLESTLDPAAEYAAITARELSRARLWYAQNTVESATRKVPADMPSHLEVQLAAPDDIGFVTPSETFYRVYFYPDAVTSTKASVEVRSISPPDDGVFYLSPDQAWQ
ncbi:MAG: hypothetical protein P9L94_11545 [Candidatus Hinthialibacter antarcticus]|nr:hypothetical protein [Candidatus Hinthialibacter antarcticus]